MQRVTRRAYPPPFGCFERDARVPGVYDYFGRAMPDIPKIPSIPGIRGCFRGAIRD